VRRRARGHGVHGRISAQRQGCRDDVASRVSPVERLCCCRHGRRSLSPWCALIAPATQRRPTSRMCVAALSRSLLASRRRSAACRSSIRSSRDAVSRRMKSRRLSCPKACTCSSWDDGALAHPGVGHRQTRRRRPRRPAS
jgi:hypothetical protein